MYFGPYEIIFGCLETDIAISTNINFVRSVTANVGDVISYSMVNPTINLAWCLVQSNTLVTNDVSGSAWAFPEKINNCPA